ncbi:hypothetical protein KFK14_11220 [Sphingobium phenoxybenzoativorans]|uniref:Uncharacterized protein n=1 Tax=Sphingobium phenoxybenzoativorans TaxID=1592790 RepID=A0A975Q3H1_9SPHN|nr:hypothetical protein [Sphingobium phenoxybenzoativorans]QUT07899.1 hypothetical protein KFK14_11220 [Sphingobium phenoxybenzoativorans]
MTNDSELGMLFAFPDASESFTLGFEAGMIWREIDDEAPLIIDRGFDAGFPVHVENIELIRRMAASRGYTVETKPEAGGWVPLSDITLGTIQPAP